MPEQELPGDGDALPIIDEVSMPLEEVQGPDPLAPGTPLSDPEGSVVRVLNLLRTEGNLRTYDGVRESDEKPVWIHEAWGLDGINSLAEEGRILEAVAIPMIPQRLSRWEAEEKAYLVTESRPGMNLEEIWDTQKPSLAQIVSMLAQVAHAVSHLHRAGWVHLGLRPKVIVPGKPTSIVSFADAVRVGEKPRRSFYYSGYSAPELLSGEPADPRSDVYGLGALLFHAINGAPIAECGASLNSWVPPAPAAGVPQILHKCLGRPETRYDTAEQLHRDLLILARRSAPRINHVAASASTIGLEPTRNSNQDASGYLTGYTEGEVGRHVWTVLCLADGMGGMASGEVASQTAVRAVLREASSYFSEFPGRLSSDWATSVKRWVVTANDEVCSALEQRGVRGGTTLVVAAVVDRELAVGHVGDSRLYLIRNGKMDLLTRDHSLAMAMALQGEIELAEVRNHPDRNKVTRSLGDRRPLPDYLVDSLEVCVQRPLLDLEPGDILLLCVDGVWEPLTEEEIATAAGASPRLDDVGRDLMRKVLARGAPDNATAVLLRIEESNGALEEAAT